MNTIYVSPNGDGDGSQRSPCGINDLTALINAARVQANEDVTVLFADGHYTMSESLRIAGQQVEQPFQLRLIAAEGARPVLSGARHLSSWEPHDAAANIWKAAVPAGVNFEHLWLGRRRLTRAWSGWNPAGFKNSKRGLKMKAGAPDVGGWGNLRDVTVTKRMMWRKIPAAVVGVNGREICLDPKELASYKVPRTALGVMEPFSLFGLLNFLELRRAEYALENAYELLTDEGEWYLDRAAATVYFKPYAEQEFAADSVLTYAGIRSFILLDGCLEKPVSKVEVSGLTFEYGAGTKFGVTAGFPTEPTKAITPTPAAALQINRGNDITVRDNRFFNMGYDAIHFDLGGKNLVVEGNGFYDISRSAISLNQTNLLVDKRSKKGVLPENRNKFFENITLSNNCIRTVGIDATAPAISFSEFVRGIRVLHNDIYDCAIHAIRNSWRYLGWRGHCGDVEYAWNRTGDVGRDGLIDFGNLYVACSNAGYTRVHHNYIDGVGKNSTNSGVYFDVFVDGGEIYNNLSLDMPVEDVWNRLGRAWVNIVMSFNTRIYGNWSNELSYRDFDQGRYRFFRAHRSNRRDDNLQYQSLQQLPAEAQEVMQKAGVEPTYQGLLNEITALVAADKAASQKRQNQAHTHS